MQAEPHRVVQTQLANAKNRGFEEHGQLPAVLEHMLQVHIYLPGGIYLGSAPSFNFDSPVMDAFLHRTVRGFHHAEKKTGYRQSTIQWRIDLAPDTHDIFAHGISRTVGDVFAYTAIFPEGSERSLWLLTFYEHLRVVVHLQPTTA